MTKYITQYCKSGALTALFVALPLTAGAETVLRLNNWLPPGHRQMTGVIEPWMEQVAEATEGRVRIMPTDASLGAPPRQYDLAVDGIADVTVGVLGYTPGRFTLAGVAELPFVGETATGLSTALWKVHEEFFQEADEYKGVQLLGLYANATGHIMTGANVTPVRQIADYGGKKFRVGGGIVQEVNPALGGVNVAVPANEVYEILSQGIADGTLLPYEAYPSFNLTGVIGASTTVPGGLYSSTWFVVMNKARFDALPPEDQQAIMSVSGAALARLAGEAQDAAETEARAIMEADGVEMIVADEAFVSEARERLAALEAQWVDAAGRLGVDGAAALEMMRQEVAAVEGAR
ncbi:TRAP transporter substrate-binding protein [Plastorhodobacter daqingensis]|uniref:TRAP transporter substrate-binding protein n=1 Tax=Plastorhodobacter daqingensis TaxID=1387281 RepID=A0ABW2UI88_9RHOB